MGFEAVEYLIGNGGFGNRVKYPLPSLVDLDLKMPRMNGFEILEWIRQQYSRDLPVIMVSGSWLQTDIANSLKLGATAYFQKTASKEEQLKMIRGMEDLLKLV